MTPPYTVTKGIAPARPHRRRFRWLRGALAVAVSLLSAADVLLSAVTGWPRVSRMGRQLGRAVLEVWRRGAGPRPIPPPSVIAVTTIEEDTTDGD
jgi:hypothetical protein